jgi:hypothetical protein
MRLAFLESLRERVSVESNLVDPPRLFISYSKRSGEMYFQQACERASALGFEVLDGFKPTEAVNVLKAVRGAILQSSLFLAILTPELRIDDRRSEERSGSFAPSVWVVEEKGMALGFGKPFRMLVHRHVHEDFWLRTTPEHLHHIFDDDRSFGLRLDEALGALAIRHEERQLASVGLGLLEEQY